MIKESILENIGDAIYGLSRDWRFTFFNRQAERFFNLSRDQVIGRRLLEAFPAARGSELEASLRDTMQSRKAIQAVVQSPTTGRWTEIRSFPLEDGGIGVSWRDITELREHERALAEALDVQDMLFRELTHRVTNNFQEIASRLSLQARELQDPTARELCADLAVSVRCMAMVHRRLYASREGVAEQDLGEYLAGLCGDLAASLSHREIRVRAAVVPGVRVASDVATTVGMMVAELTMNSAKYAWPAGEGGNISVTLRRDGDVIEVEFRDDGRGLPAVSDIEAAGGLGMRLLLRQIRRIKGSLAFERAAGGAMFHLRFPAPDAGAEPQREAAA